MNLPDGTVAPLAGIRVVEMGTVITAPLAARLVGEFGAEVIKVEKPKGGDTFRNFYTGPESPIFDAYNKSKKSITLDIKDSISKEQFRHLIQTADVLLDNFRPGVLTRLGFSWDILHALNPRLIHCSITGFGKDGPYAHRPSFDTVTLALSGIAASQLDPENPRFTGPTVSDNVTGMYAALGILGALYERSVTGIGRRLEINMLEASIAFIPDHYSNYLAGLTPRPNSRAALSQCFAGTCRDGKLIAIHLSSQEKFWLGMLTVLGLIDLKDDERFRTRADRYKYYFELTAIVDGALKANDRGKWMAALEAADVPFAPIYSVAESLEDEQARHLGTFVRSQLADGTPGVSIRSPIWVDGKRMKTPARAPMLGEHNQEFTTDGPVKMEADK